VSALDLRDRFPWTEAEQAYVVAAKRGHVRHKAMARTLRRSPRAIDQKVARMKELGLLKMHEREEIELVEILLAEAALPEWYPEGRR